MRHLNAVKKAKKEGKKVARVRKDVVRRIIENQEYKSISTAYKYTDDYAFDNANDFGRNNGMSHEEALEIAQNWLKSGAGDTVCYIDIEKDENVISIIPYSNLCYRMEMPAADEKKKTTKKAAAKKPAKKVEMKEENKQKPATKKQLWALHCITKLDTRGLDITREEASELISQAKQNVNINIIVKNKINKAG